MTIEFHIGPNGKAIPLQKVRTVYTVSAGPNEVEKALVSLAGLPSTQAFVSHFETCPKAGEFSRGKAKAETPV